VLAGQLRIDQDAELQAAREASVGPIDKIIATAHADGSLRPDVVSGDIGLLLVRLTRPLPGPFAPEIAGALAHRHLDLLLAGLRSPNPPGAALPEPAMTFDDLRAMRPGAPPREEHTP
jgi:hypothetical protein